MAIANFSSLFGSKNGLLGVQGGRSETIPGARSLGQPQVLPSGDRKFKPRATPLAGRYLVSLNLACLISGNTDLPGLV